MNRIHRQVAGSALVALFVAGCAPDTPADPAVAADLVLRGGTVVTVDELVPEAEAIAIRGDTIVAVGSNEEIGEYIGTATRVIELDGMLAIPGFIEGHAHFTSLGRSKLSLDLMDVANWDEVVALVAAAVRDAAPGVPITGRGWHQEKWDRVPEGAVEGLPTHHSLSAVSPDNPVVLTHASGHASFANAKAMELAGITKDTPDPAGGEIVRDADGNPTGAFRETAAGLLGAATRDAPSPDPDRVIELAVQEALANGITSLQDAGSNFASVERWKRAVDEGRLGIRLYVMLRASPAQLANRAEAGEIPLVGYGDNRLTVRAIKYTIDGALGSHGAWLLEPYSDMPESSGLNTGSIERLEETARVAIQHGLQLNVHAIGDRANREVLDIYERTFADFPDRTDLRWRIEHAQHLSAQDIPRFAELGVIASMQGIHATSDAPWVYIRLGERRAEEGAYVWQKLLKSGAVVINGTDAPVERISPIASYYASVSRKLADGSVFFPDQRMSRMEALKSYTLSAAYAAFEEDIKGSLVPGKLADITVLSKNILTIPEDEIPSTEVVYTIVGGKVMYSKGEVIATR